MFCLKHADNLDSNKAYGMAKISRQMLHIRFLKSCKVTETRHKVSDHPCPSHLPYTLKKKKKKKKNGEKEKITKNDHSHIHPPTPKMKKKRGKNRRISIKQSGENNSSLFVLDKNRPIN